MLKKLSIVLVLTLLLVGCVMNSTSEDSMDPMSMSQNDAEYIALKNTNLRRNDIDELNTQFIDDFLNYYDIMFEYDNTFYNYKISETSGVLLDVRTNDKELGVLKLGETLSDEEKAKYLAINDARISVGDITQETITTENNNIGKTYNVDFYADEVHYTYRISGESLSIIEMKSSYLKPSVSFEKKINISQATETALSKVQGATVEDIAIIEGIKDGIPFYEGSVLFEGIDYEFEISAINGEVLKWNQGDL